MCLSELQARLNVGQPLFPTHALCIRRSQQHRSPPAGIDFRKSRFADVDVPFLIIRPLRLS